MLFNFAHLNGSLDDKRNLNRFYNISQLTTYYLLSSPYTKETGKLPDTLLTFEQSSWLWFLNAIKRVFASFCMGDSIVRVRNCIGLLLALG
jgi:hypothetical protein